MNERETTQVLAVLSTVWPEKPITPETIQAYHWALEDQPFGAVKQAAGDWVRSEKWFPKPAELIARAKIIAAEHDRAERRNDAKSEYQLPDLLRIQATMTDMGITNPSVNQRIADLQRLTGVA